MLRRLVATLLALLLLTGLSLSALPDVSQWCTASAYFMMAGIEEGPRMEPTKKATSKSTLKARARTKKPDGEGEVLANLAGLPTQDRRIGERLHAIVRATAPELVPRLWYGMPAYGRNGKIVCFFQSAQRFKTRYATFGFMHEANLDDGAMWPTAYALKEITEAEEERIAALVKQAVR